jgi:hypothetical protein
MLSAMELCKEKKFLNTIEKNEQVEYSILNSNDKLNEIDKLISLLQSCFSI